MTERMLPDLTRNKDTSVAEIFRRAAERGRSHQTLRKGGPDAGARSLYNRDLETSDEAGKGQPAVERTLPTPGQAQEQPPCGIHQVDYRKDEADESGHGPSEAVEVSLTGGPATGRQPLLQPMSSSNSPVAVEDLRWLEAYQRSEIRFLSVKVEELEQRIRRRTIMLAGAVAFGVLSIATAAGVVVAWLPEEPLQAHEQRIATLERDLHSAQQQFEDRRAALEQQLASMTQARDRAVDDLKARDQQIALLESDLAREREAAEQNRAEVQQLKQQLTMVSQTRDQDIRDLQARDQRTMAQESSATPSAPGGAADDDLSRLGASDGGQASGAGYYRAATHTNLRAAPSGTATVIAVIEPGAIMRALEQRNGWLRVEYAGRLSRTSTGWIYGALLRPAKASLERGGPTVGP